MKPSLKRILVIVMCIVMLAGSTVFAADAGVSIVSPASNAVVSGNSLLVSVKCNKQKSVRVTVFEEKTKNAKGVLEHAVVSGITKDNVASLAEIYSDAVKNDKIYIDRDTEKKYFAVKLDDATVRYYDVVYMEAAEYKTGDEVGFFTKQLSEVSPGLYRVQVEVLNSRGETTETLINFVAVTPKQSEEKTEVLETQQKNTIVTFLQNLLRSLFR